MPQPVTSIQRLFTGLYLSLERRMIALPDGREAPREIVLVKNAVAVMPIHEDGTVVLVRQFRPAIGEDLLEIPAGVIDEGETAEEAVRRELVEEIGFEPVTLRHLFDYYHAEGYSTGVMHLYAAIGLRDAGGPSPEDGEILAVETLSFEETLRGVLAGGFRDSKTMLAALRVAELRRLGELRFG